MATEPDQIRVVNVRDGIPGAIYIGRYNKAWKLSASPLANPYSLQDYGARALGLYDDDIDEALVTKRGPVYQELNWLAKRVAAGQSVALACWCRTVGGNEPCHGDIVKAAIEMLVKAG